MPWCPRYPGVRIKRALKGKKVRAAFDEDSGKGELLIAAETGNQFEAGSMFKPLADQSRVRKIVEEIGLVTEIIDMVVRPARLDAAEAIRNEDATHSPDGEGKA